VRALTPVEAAIVVAVAGSVLAVTLPEFLRNLHASRLVEPIDGLKQIAGRASALAAGRPTERAYPSSVGLTPEQVPRGERVVDPPGTWDHPTWRALVFQQRVPHGFSFAFESENAPGVATFTASAHGDLDGDGIVSTFEVSGQSLDGHGPMVFALQMYREVE
jgi:hypothetical protein